MTPTNRLAGKRHRVADVERIGLKPLLLGFNIPATTGAATAGLWLQPWRVCRIASIFAFLFSNVDDLSTLRKVEGWQRARVARLSNLHRRTLASYCDDDNFWCSMRALLRPVSWLGSHTKHVTAATSSLCVGQQGSDDDNVVFTVHSLPTTVTTPADAIHLSTLLIQLAICVNTDTNAASIGDNSRQTGTRNQRRVSCALPNHQQVRSVCVVRCWFECSSEEMLRMSANSASCRVQSLLT
ncbi:hypothetical protein Tco_0548395 [Tanacetum coccineum]